VQVTRGKRWSLKLGLRDQTEQAQLVNWLIITLINKCCTAPVWWQRLSEGVGCASPVGTRRVGAGDASGRGVPPARLVGSDGTSLALAAGAASAALSGGELLMWLWKTGGEGILKSLAPKWDQAAVAGSASSPCAAVWCVVILGVRNFSSLGILEFKSFFACSL